MTTTFKGVVKTIEQYMKDNWISTPIAFDNVSFTPPINLPWTRITVIEGDSTKHDLLTRVRSMGMVDIQSFTTLLNGSLTARDQAHSLFLIWNRLTLGNIMFRTPSIHRVGDTKDGWFQMNVSVPYYWDENF